MKYIIYKTQSSLVLTYRCESERQRVEIIKLTFEKKFFQCKEEEWSLQRRYYFELEREDVEPDIKSVIKANPFLR